MLRLLLKLLPWLSIRRSRTRDIVLGALLALIAGATNAGGFLAVNLYTSHMTGMVSSLADHLVRQHYALMIGAIGAIISFLAGTMSASFIISFGRRQRLRSRYSLIFVLEAALLLLFGLLGYQLDLYTPLFMPATVLVLCFLMGLQNAGMSIITHSRIRTTHVTGIVTDLGIELGRLVYINYRKHDLSLKIKADRSRLWVNVLLLSLFVVGAFIGAFGFNHFGFALTLPIAGVLIILALPTVLVDLYHLKQLKRQTPNSP